MISLLKEPYNALYKINYKCKGKERNASRDPGKPIPSVGKRTGQMPAKEHLSIQIARQIFGIETAENTLVFLKNRDPAYITKRFYIKEDCTKWAIEDFASLSSRKDTTNPRLENGLLPLDKSKVSVTQRFFKLAELAGISPKQLRSHLSN